MTNRKAEATGYTPGLAVQVATLADECHEEVIRSGELEPCDKPAVAARIDPTEGTPYPVCGFHARADMVPLRTLLAAHAAPTAAPPAGLAEVIGLVLDRHVGWQMHRAQMADDLATVVLAHLADTEGQAGLAEVLAAHRLHASMNICTCGDWQATPDAGSLRDQHAAHVAAAITAAGWRKP